MDRSSQIDAFSRFTRVSRETITSLIKYEKMLIKANNDLNLIGKSTIPQIWARHFLDSVQVIDFIDKNDGTIMDIGSGAGFPGLIIAIGLKDRKIPSKIKLIEKSAKKINFLKSIAVELDLKVEIIKINIVDDPIKIMDQVLVSRAFKPLDTILKLIHNKAQNWKKIFIFLGKTGQDELLRASKNWDIKYKKRESITNSDSMIIEISNLDKK